MPLSNSQYNAIMRMYEEKQRRSRYLLEQRKDAVYQQIPEYEKLDHQVSSTSIVTAARNKITVILSMNIARTADMIINVIKTGMVL